MSDDEDDDTHIIKRSTWPGDGANWWLTGSQSQKGSNQVESKGK
jgi:hypothetical protein